MFLITLIQEHHFTTNHLTHRSDDFA